MDNLTDSELIANIRANTESANDCLKTIIDRHSGIFFTMVKRYLKNNDYCVCEEVVNDKDLLIYNTVLKYDESKGTKFSTFLGNEARWSCINAATKHRKNDKFVDFNANLDFQNMTYEINLVEEHEKENLLKTILQNVQSSEDQRIIKIFNLRYQDTKKITPWRTISKEIGLSIQGCINIHNKAVKSILKNIKKHEINSKQPA